MCILWSLAVVLFFSRGILVEGSEQRHCSPPLTCWASDRSMNPLRPQSDRPKHRALVCSLPSFVAVASAQELIHAAFNVHEKKKKSSRQNNQPSAMTVKVVCCITTRVHLWWLGLKGWPWVKPVSQAFYLIDWLILAHFLLSILQSRASLQISPLWDICVHIISLPLRWKNACNSCLPLNKVCSNLRYDFMISIWQQPLKQWLS